jgi:hypothetical protein
VLERLSFSGTSKWESIAVLAGFLAGFQLLAFVLLSFSVPRYLNPSEPKHKKAQKA